MKKIVLPSSLGAAALAAFLTHLYLARLEADVSGGARIAVLVAAEDIPVGAALTESQLAVRDVPQAFVEGRQVRASEIKKVIGAKAAGGLKANEGLLWTDLAKFNDRARVLSGLVQNGMRAVPLDLRSADFDGLLRPGDRVDVLFSTGAKSDEGATQTLLQNLLVLSVGGTLGSDGESAAGARGGVTLSATIEQAQILTQAQLRGRLSLTLRNTDDLTLAEGLPETRSRDLQGRERNDAPRRTAGTKGAIDHVR